MVIPHVYVPLGPTTAMNNSPAICISENDAVVVTPKPVPGFPLGGETEIEQPKVPPSAGHVSVGTADALLIPSGVRTNGAATIKAATVAMRRRSAAILKPRRRLADGI
jgi:hypothetical protein